MLCGNVLGTSMMLVIYGCVATVSQGWAATPDLTIFDIEDLMQIKVVSAAKVEQALQDTASAVFVITADDIRRSGVTSVPEALRMAPGVQVARIGANKWAITIRGFNGRFANKLLVLVDGRSIYTPTFSGVYWEVQDMLIEDIERIEVIRGPGASLWGANAVNGVINILTKRAADTRNLLSVTAGNQEKAIVGVRYSSQLGDDAHYRIYGKYLNQDGLLDVEGRDAEDDWYLSSGGFRLDWTPTSQDSVTLGGSVYDATLHQNLLVPTFTPPYAQRVRDAAQDSGGNLQGRWERRFSPTSNMDLKLYYQRERHDEAILGVMVDTFDLDFQHTFALNERHALIWGLGYRRYHDEYQQTALGSITPSSLDYDLFSAFVQDQISLIPQELELTLGARLEHNDFSGWEFQPNARLLWKLHPRHRVWAAVSRAVRTPSRADQGLNLDVFTVPPNTPPRNPTPLPALYFFQGNPAFGSENLTAYEIGYRAVPSEQLSLDVTAFYNDYDDLRAVDVRGDLAMVAGRLIKIPDLFVNAGQGHTYGFEAAVSWQAQDWWRFQLAYTFLQTALENKPGISDSLSPPLVRNGAQPHQQISLRSSFDIRHDLEFDLWLYYVSELSDLAIARPELTTSVDAYFSVSARLGWRPRWDLELSLVGANLLGPSHVEFVQETYSYPEQVERSIYGQMKWSF